MQNALKEIASTEPNCYLNSEKYSWLIKQELSYSVVLNYPCTLTYFCPIDTFMITFLLILILKHRIIPKMGSPVYNPIPLLFENKRTFLWSFSPCICRLSKIILWILLGKPIFMVTESILHDIMTQTYFSFFKLYSYQFRKCKK